MSEIGVNTRPNVAFKAEQTDNSNIITRPIDKVEGVLNDAVDVFVPETQDEERKKTRKKAIYAVSSVFVLSVLAAILNPKFSSKAIDRVKELSKRAEAKMQTSDNPFVKKFYYATNEVLKFSGGLFQFANNTKGMKDKGVSWLCKSKKFEKMDDGFFKKMFQTIDNTFVKVMTKVHSGISKAFDAISKKTVYLNYRKVGKKLDTLEETFKLYKSKLPQAKQAEFEAKLKQIADTRKYFTKERTAQRLAAQEVAMSDLQKEFDEKMWGYFKGFEGVSKKGSWKHNWKQFKDNLSFWAEDILMPKRNMFNRQGKIAVDELIGNTKTKTGKYRELLDILSPHISQEDKKLLTNKLEKAEKKLRKANIAECKEYFDKKRDLVLGGAPTDILTAAGTLAIGGVAIGAADKKEDKMSRAVQFVAPAVVGFGVHLTLTAMLVSGVKSLLIGLATSGLTSIAGSMVKKHLIYKPQAQAETKEATPDNTKNEEKEVKVA